MLPGHKTLTRMGLPSMTWPHSIANDLPSWMTAALLLLYTLQVRPRLAMRPLMDPTRTMAPGVL